MSYRHILTQYIENISQFLILLFPLTLFLGPAALDSTLTVVAILFILFSLINQDLDYFNIKWFQVFVLFWTFLVIRSIFSLDPDSSLSGSLPFGRFGFFAMAICYWIKKSPGLLDKINLAIFATITLVSISTVFQFYAGYDFLGNEPLVSTGSIRLKSFANKLNVGIMLTFLYLPYAANLITKLTSSQSRKKLSLYWLFLCIPILAIFLSGERTAFLLTLLGLIILFIVGKKSRKILLKFFFILGVIISSLAFFRSDIAERQFASTYNQIGNFESSSYGRIFRTATDIFLDNPLFGTSPRSFFVICKNWYSYDPNYYCTNHPHNLYLEVASETGVVGLLFFLLLLYSLFSYLYQNRISIVSHPFILGATLTFIFRYIPLISSGSYYIAWSMAASWFMLGIALSSTKNDKI